MFKICDALLSRNGFINKSIAGVVAPRVAHREHSANAQLTENDVEEVRIPMPWGHIAGKWWGKKDENPMIAIHGWQDNANSFDALVPLLNVNSFLAIDLPGHGLSSHLPKGKVYTFVEYMCVIKRIAEHYNWSSYSVCGHSYGSVLAYVHSSLYPDEVKCFISLDCARTSLLMLSADLPGTLANGVKDILNIEEKIISSPLPAYKLSDMIQMSFKGSMGSISSIESALILLKRGVVKCDSNEGLRLKGSKPKYILEDLAKHDAIDGGDRALLTGIDKDKEKAWSDLKEKTRRLENREELYCYTRDPKIRVFSFGLFNEEQLAECAKYITCPVLSLRAEKGFIQGPYVEPYNKSNDIIRERCKYFESHTVKGSHHTHLNTPENVAPILNGKYWGPRNRRTFLLLHGWQDNAGSWDALVPLLPPEYSYLAIDLPGHGYSSHLPKGMFYTRYDMLVRMRQIQRYFEWPKMSLVGHSMGSMFSFLYSALFADDVDVYVGIDFMKPVSVDLEASHKEAANIVKKLKYYDSLDAKGAAAYTETDLVEKLKKSLNAASERGSRILLRRGAAKTSDGFLKLLRDPKVKALTPFGFTHGDNAQFANRIRCNVLVIKSSETTYYEPKANFYAVLDIVKSRAKYFEYHKIRGLHHLHLETPENVAPIIREFLDKIKR